MPKRATHHFHALVDPFTNTPTGGAIEHDHLANPGRRHAHYFEYDTVLAELLAAGWPDGKARLQAFHLDGRPQGTLDLRQNPDFATRTERSEQDELARLHPEMRRVLS